MRYKLLFTGVLSPPVAAVMRVHPNIVYQPIGIAHDTLDYQYSKGDPCTASDNKNQGLYRFPARIGNGRVSAANLYWGCRCKGVSEKKVIALATG